MRPVAVGVADVRPRSPPGATGQELHPVGTTLSEPSSLPPEGDWPLRRTLDVEQVKEAATEPKRSTRSVRLSPLTSRSALPLAAAFFGPNRNARGFRRSARM